MEARLAAITLEGDQKARTASYRAVLDACLAPPHGDVEGLKAIVVHMLSDDVPLVISRQILQVLCQEVARLPGDQHAIVAGFALDRLSPRTLSFEEQVSVLREGLAALYQGGEEWSRAAKVLAGIDLDSGIRVLTDEYKLQKCVQIAMLYLEDDDAVNAETFIKKASFLLAACKDETLELQFKTCYARILDAKRRFIEAALRYYELSQVEPGRTLDNGKVYGEENLSAALTNAITCAILAAAGPQRSRVLATLYKDERCAQLAIFPMLEKVYMERILRRAEVDAFASTLKPHQLAVGADGLTVLARAMSEHNLLSASKLYTNIEVQELGQLLGVDGDTAERTAAKMISEGRMAGSIDQVERIINFEDADDAAVTVAQWDQQIMAVCLQVNAVVELMDKKGITVGM